MPRPTAETRPPIVVLFGEDEFQKSRELRAALAELVPTDADRELILAEFDGARTEADGGPSVAAVFDDLRTLPFLADRRIVVVRDAEKFISASREALERYMHAPSPTGTLVLVCRSFPKTTRLYRASQSAGGRIVECKKLTGRALEAYVVDRARASGKRMDPQLAARLIELVGADAGVLSTEVDKLCLFADKRPIIAPEDIDQLIGQSREERVFAAMDAAALGRLGDALNLWHDVLSSDPAGAFKAVGGVAYMLRRWLTAQRFAATGENAYDIAPKVLMWNRPRDLEQILRRLPAARIRRILASLAQLDSQAKVGLRSIERGVEAILAEVAASAA